MEYFYNDNVTNNNNSNMSKISENTSTETSENVQTILHNLSEKDLEEALPNENSEKDNIEEIKESNSVLLVSEKDKKVYLPYSKEEILAYLEQYPNQYNSYADVINQEFILNSDIYMKRPVLARFREAYSLLRDRELKPVLEALKFALNMMFHYELNPVIIAACKTQEQLENYLNCIEHKKINDFKDFEIQFEITPHIASL